MEKIYEYIKKNILYLISIIFTWGIPIYMLNEKIALTKNVSAGVKLSTIGALVVLIVLLVTYGKVKGKIDNFKPSTKKGLSLKIIFKVLHNVILLGVCYWLISNIIVFLTIIFNWYKMSLISIAIGLIIYVIDMIIKFNGDKNGREEV